MSSDKKEFKDTVTVCADKNYSRLDIFLSEELSLSRSFIKEIIDAGFVVSDKKIKPSMKILNGDKFVVNIPHEKTPDITPKDMDLEIIFENEHFAIINKPHGIVVHPAPGNYTDTLVNGLVYKLNITGFDGDFRPGIVHRLDKDTSGIMIIAKNRAALEKLSCLFKSREIEKRYLAVCLGKPKREHFLIDKSIGRSKLNRQKMCIDLNGRNALSEVWVRELFDNSFLAEIRIHTGRTHQIRVHMLSEGFPLLGDILYGGEKCMKFQIDRQALHSSCIKFTSPFDNNIYSFQAELPDDFKNLLYSLRRKN